MALGKCPVIISDQFVPPDGPDWEAFSIFVPEDKINILKQTLEKEESSYADLGDKAYQNWEKFFSPSNVCNYYTIQLFNLIQVSKSSNVQSEFKRWDSYDMSFNNNWTIPQRLLNKVKKNIPFF